MTNYSRGRSKEYELKRQLEEDGYTVLRTAGSHGAFDLICYKQDTEVSFYQVKYSMRSAPTKKELEAFENADLPNRSTAYLVHFQRGNTTPTVVSRKHRKDE